MGCSSESPDIVAAKPREVIPTISKMDADRPSSEPGLDEIGQSAPSTPSTRGTWPQRKIKGQRNWWEWWTTSPDYIPTDSAGAKRAHSVDSGLDNLKRIRTNEGDSTESLIGPPTESPTGSPTGPPAESPAGSRDWVTWWARRIIFR